MFPSSTIIKTDVLFPRIPDTSIAPIRPLEIQEPSNIISSPENTIVKGSIVDANSEAARVMYMWPNGQVVNPIIPGKNTYTKGSEVDVVIKSTPPYTFVRLVQTKPSPR